MDINHELIAEEIYDNAHPRRNSRSFRNPRKGESAVVVLGEDSQNSFKVKITCIDQRQIPSTKFYQTTFSMEPGFVQAKTVPFMRVKLEAYRVDKRRLFEKPDNQVKMAMVHCRGHVKSCTVFSGVLAQQFLFHPGFHRISHHSHRKD